MRITVDLHLPTVLPQPLESWVCFFLPFFSPFTCGPAGKDQEFTCRSSSMRITVDLHLPTVLPQPLDRPSRSSWSCTSPIGVCTHVQSQLSRAGGPKTREGTQSRLCTLEETGL